MRVITTEYLIQEGTFSQSPEWAQVYGEIKAAIHKVVWPPGNDKFIINPSRGRGRGEGNGVRPIKDTCMSALEQSGWSIDERHNLLRIDAIKTLADGKKFALEWETGNISSSHRAINRILLGHVHEMLVGGVLVVPSRNLYRYLTDRIGNYAELEPYFDVWSLYPLEDGMLVIISVEQDGESENVPRIQKGTDGRALV